MDLANSGAGSGARSAGQVFLKGALDNKPVFKVLFTQT